MKQFLKSNESIRQKLLNSNYVRRYGFSNEFEFTAVLLECFFESNTEFKSEFPEIYSYIERMLSFGTRVT